MAKTLVLHIGTGKTGSTAIQDYLRDNVAGLSRFGIVVPPADLVPGTKIVGHQAALVEHYRQNIPEGRRVIQDRIDTLMAEMKPGQKLVISAEGLSIPDGIHRLFDGARDKYDLRVVLYIRRQDDFLLSAWEQWGSRKASDFWAWLTFRVGGSLGNWRQVLIRWEQVVPRNQIIVRVYERSLFPNGDVVADFLQVLGIADKRAEPNNPKKPSNPSYTGAVQDLARGVPSAVQGKQANEFYKIVEQLTGNRYHRSRSEPLLTFQQRLAILDRYAESNAWVQQNYFPQKEGLLFEAPQPNEPSAEITKSTTAQKWDLLASLIHGLGKRILGNAN